MGNPSGKPLISIDIHPSILYEPDLIDISGGLMIKSQLIETLRKETNLTKAQTEQVVELFFNEMSSALTNGDRVEIRDLCSIFVKKYKGYAGRNPKTGEQREVPAKKLPFFKCGKELKERVDCEETKTQ
jgi:integration host factor subunit beta